MFKNKNVVITGSNRGIGYSILEIFSKNKANIWACSRKKDPNFLDQIKKLSNENEIKIKNINFDLNNIDQVKESAKKIINEAKGYAIERINIAEGDATLFKMILADYN